MTSARSQEIQSETLPASCPPPALRRTVLLMKDKQASGTTLEDAETLAAYGRLARGTNGISDFVQDAMA